MTATIASTLRFSVCTYNIWTDTRWPERRSALFEFASRVAPDVLCLQEVQPESLKTIEEALPDHRRVDDDFGGWTNEGQILWHKDRFTLEDSGAEDIGILEPLRRLFWARLRSNDNPSTTILVATAHFTWYGHTEARATNTNVRVPQAEETMAALDRLRVEHEPQLFMGDLNDSGLPIEILRGGGFVDCFAGVGQPCAATHPAAPTAAGPPSTLDWLMLRGPGRFHIGHVIDFFAEDLAPSDHKPVIAMVEIGS